MTSNNFKRTKLACYSAYYLMSSIFILPPLLFMTFHEMYGISYTLLGTLVLTNFCTQLTIDLIFTFFSKHFNVHKIVKTMPLITSLGLLLYAFAPLIFPDAVFVGLFIGTVIFSVSAGFSEVLLSPVIAAIPSDNPQRDMSTLHSLYAFGVLTVVIISTIFLKFFGNDNWMYLTVFFAALPVISAVLFMISPMPNMDNTSTSSTFERTKKKGIGLTICVVAIFFGSCAENVMSNWISSYMENALHIDKALGDILGIAIFAVLLGLVRITYAKYGKNICKFLLIGMIGATICYLVAGLSNNIVTALIACVLTGLFTSMLWPGALIMMEENIPGVGVAAYALMASSGDLGASVAPQMMGIIVDKVSVSNFAKELAQSTGMATEEIGMKVGMLVNSVFPTLGIITLIIAIVYFRKKRQNLK
ncbi:MAG: MFS transporter [Ruminococcaceae bacterium]|nr:MFS transporter [Oscillospiraceae bacterium]